MAIDPEVGPVIMGLPETRLEGLLLASNSELFTDRSRVVGKQEIRAAWREGGSVPSIP